MNYKFIVTIFSVFSFVSGTACVLAPTRILSGYGVTLPPMGLVIYQFWGATLMGAGMLTWFARNITENDAQTSFSAVLFVMNALSCIMAVRGQFAGANSLGWSTVAIYLLFASGFGFLILTNRGVSVV